MNFEVVHVSRGEIRLKNENNFVRVLGEALIASTPTDPSYVVYLNSLNNWEMPTGAALIDKERKSVIEAIFKHFEDLGSMVEFE